MHDSDDYWFSYATSSAYRTDEKNRTYFVKIEKHLRVEDRVIIATE